MHQRNIPQWSGNMARIGSALSLREAHQRRLVRRAPDSHEEWVRSIWRVAGTAVRELDATDAYTAGHSVRVGELAGAMGVRMGLTSTEVQLLRLGGALHDIGKLRVPRELMTKPGKLTPEEYRRVMTHPEIGARILAPLGGRFPTIIAVVRSHHERVDGTGLPDGLGGANIPLAARIVSVADAFDAMTSARPYRTVVRSTVEALAELEGSAGTQFDCTCVQALVTLCGAGLHAGGIAREAERTWGGRLATRLAPQSRLRDWRRIGAAGFEPATSWSQTRRATGLRHAPKRSRTGTDKTDRLTVSYPARGTGVTI